MFHMSLSCFSYQKIYRITTIDKNHLKPANFLIILSGLPNIKTGKLPLKKTLPKIYLRTRVKKNKKKS